MVSLRHVKFLVTLTAFQSHNLVYKISFEQLDGYLPDLHRYSIWKVLRVLDFGDLDFIFQVTQGLKYVKFALKMTHFLSHWLDFLPNLHIYTIWTK